MGPGLSGALVQLLTRTEASTCFASWLSHPPPIVGWTALALHYLNVISACAWGIVLTISYFSIQGRNYQRWSLKLSHCQWLPRSWRDLTIDMSGIEHLYNRDRSLRCFITAKCGNDKKHQSTGRRRLITYYFPVSLARNWIISRKFCYVSGYFLTLLHQSALSISEFQQWVKTSFW